MQTLALNVLCPACGADPGVSCREARMPIGLDPYNAARPLFARRPHLKRAEIAARPYLDRHFDRMRPTIEAINAGMTKTAGVPRPPIDL